MAEALLMRVGSAARGVTETSKPVFEKFVTALAEHRLRVELNALDRPSAMTEAHDRPAGRAGCDLQFGGDGRRIHRQRVVSGGRERVRQAGQQTLTGVVDQAGVAVE